MAIRFAKGESMKTTHTTRQFGKAVQHKPSMKGMPGSIRTGQDASKAGLTQNTGIGPKREGPIGKSGSPGVKGKFSASSSRGSADKSYRATSTGPAGRISSGKLESLKGRVKFSSEK